MKKTVLRQTVALLALSAASALTVLAQFPDATTGTTTTTTVTSVTGTISQLNYDNDGAVSGFLVGTNVLLSFPSRICAGITSLGAVGNSVTYSGTARTATSGFQSVQLTSFTNNTTKATYTAPTPTTTATAYGPTSGTIKQLNYGPDGVVDGFLFSAGSTSVLVSTGARASTTLASLLTVGASVSVTGTTSPAMAACASTGSLTTVDATSLTISGQTIVIAGGGNAGGNGGPGGFRGPGRP